MPESHTRLIPWKEIPVSANWRNRNDEAILKIAGMAE